MILFLDVETNGLPKNYQAPLDEFENWPRAVQVAWARYTNSGEFLNSTKALVKPDRWTISAELTKIHGLTTEICETGTPIVDILDSLACWVAEADYIVAHNVDFDTAILGSEFLRAGMDNPFLGKRFVCTMKESTDYCAIGSGRDGRYKWPKLSELYATLFPGEQIENEHDALSDTLACARCFWELVRHGVITVESEPMIVLPDGTDIQKLARARQILAQLKGTKQAMLESVTQDVIYIGLEKQIKEVQALQETLESQIRECGLKQYEADHNKTPGTGWSVKVFKKVEVMAGVDLKEWCLHNFTPALKVDEKLVEKAAIAGGIPKNVVTVKDDPRVQIESDLDKYVVLEKAEPDDEDQLPF